MIFIISQMSMHFLAISKISLNSTRLRYDPIKLYFAINAKKASSSSFKLSKPSISTICYSPSQSCYTKNRRNEFASVINFSTSQLCRTTEETGYSNFTHGRDKIPTRNLVLVYGCLVLCVITAFMELRETSKITEIMDQEADAANERVDEESKQENAKEEKDKKKKITFRDKKVMAYEDKIRAFSTPEKIFRYFATLKVYFPSDPSHFEVFMTPEDFFRSLTPGMMQPEGLGLEQFAVFNPQTYHLPKTLDENSVFCKLGKHGLISYTDYIFLLTLLSTSPRHFSLAFKMFDINGDGHLDYNEFEMVENVIRHQTTIGAQHRDHASSGTVLRHHTNSSLASYFFGANKDEKLSIEKFLEFQQHLQADILKMEFERQEPEDGRISEVAFSKMLLQHSSLEEKRQQKMLKRVKSHYAKKKDSEKDGQKLGLTMCEVSDFFRFLTNIADVDTALTFYRMGGTPVDPTTLKHVARTVARISIPDHVLETVFVLFDENQNGELSNREFVHIMKRRLNRGLERRKDTGFLRTMSAMWRCGVDMIPGSHHHHTHL